MNKKEAAQYLGCSERAIERYVKAGKLSCTYEKGKNFSNQNLIKSNMNLR
jgi:excisionase family DNA binding protein